MGNAPLALAFTAGMLATLNPCGFAMLPAYLSYFVGMEDDPDQRGGAEHTVMRALAVAAVMTAGFVVVFGLMGLLIVQVSSRVQEHLPWVTIVIGLTLVGLGIAALSGRSLTIRLPHMQKGTSSRELPSMFVFGISYALSSLSCTIGPFLAATSTTFNDGGLVAGTATFITYGLGMGAIVGLLTLAVALARNGVVSRFRRLMRYVNTASGALMLLAGAYMAYYGWYEIRLRDGPVDDPIIDRALAVQGWLTDQVDRIGTTRIGIIAGVTIAGCIAAIITWRLARRDTSVDRVPLSSRR